MLRRAVAVLLACAAFTGSQLARADVSFHGFGQIVVGSTLSNDHPIENQSYTADPSFTNESLFALQVQTSLAEHTEATTQIVASGANGEDFQPKFEWAYVSYWFGDHWIVKAGRQRLPLYRYSESLEMGQSYTWVRPPPSVYEGAISDFDGLTLNGYYELGNWRLQPSFSYGAVNSAATYNGSTGNINLRNGTGLSLEANYSSWLELRASGFRSTGSIHVGNFDPLTNFVLPNSTGDNSSVIAGLSPNDHSVIFYGFGAELHPGNFVLGGEYNGTRENDTVLPRYKQYYVRSGYRFGRLTPQLTYGHVDSASSDPGLLGQVAPGSMCPTGVDLTTGQPANFFPCTTVVGSVINAQRELSDYDEVTLRYDLTESTAFKLDWTRYLPHQPLGDGIPGYNHGANLVSMALTFVF